MNSSKKRILVCDDDEDILDLIRFILGKKYKVITRQEVKNSVEMVEEADPDLILMDLWIPHIGGEMAVANIKNDVRFEKIPIIYCSASNQIGKVAKRSRADGIIEKPFELTELKTIVENHL